MPGRRRALTDVARPVLLRHAPLAAVLVAGAAVLWLVRPGIVTNGVRSPVLWLVVIGVVAGAKLLSLLVRRLTGRAAAGTATSLAVGLVASYVLLAPSFTQRTLEEPFPDLGPVAAAPQGAAPQASAPDAEPSPEPATQSPAASTPPPRQAAPAQPQAATATPPPAARQSRQAPRSEPDRPAEAQTPPPVASAPASGGSSKPAPAAASSARQVSSGELEGVGHSARGRTAFYEVDGEQVLRFEDVDIEGTPGPVVHLVPRGARSPGDGVRVGELKAEKGTFSYVLPASVDLQQGWTVLVWCEPYDTPIAASDH